MRIKWYLCSAAVLFCGVTAGNAAERINQEGRILKPLPVVPAPTLFNTSAADAIVSGMQIFPLTSPWNEDISQRPLLSNSAAMISQISGTLSSSRQGLRAFYEMNYVLVPDSQPAVPINFVDYPDESDPSPYPLPSDLPIEGWPAGESTPVTLPQVQQGAGDSGDRHSIAVMPGGGYCWETWMTVLTSTGWQAANGAKFNLNSNALRPSGWTSGDAAGLCMFGAVVRYDECQRGMVEHAMRICVPKTRAEYLYPATHYASSIPATSVNYPAMGQRLRLKSSFVIPTTWSLPEQAICKGLKKYGALVADNGNFISISVCPDDRFASNAFDDLSSGVHVTDFEVIQSTGATEGPRAPGAPTANAGSNITLTLPSKTAALNGRVTGSNLTVKWTQYSGPGTVGFGNASQAATTASFSAPGDYQLMLSASDGTHAVARDAITVTVMLPVRGARSGNNYQIQFPTDATQVYRVERSGNLTSEVWTILQDNLPGSGNPMTITDVNGLSLGSAFYRVQALR